MPIHPEHAAAILDEVAADDAIFTVDTRMNNVWAARYSTPNGRRRMIGSFLHGSMASALPHTTIAGNHLTVRVLSSDDNAPSGPAALDSGGPTTMLRTSITGNQATITVTTGGAGSLAAIGFFSGGSDPVSITGSAITSNRVAAIARDGAATVQGAGITNAGALVLDHTTIDDNHGTATGLSGFAQGAGIWNGEIFGIPTAPPTLRHTHVTGNVLTASPGLQVQGGGLYTVGFPPQLTDSQLAGNLPDQCAGC